MAWNNQNNFNGNRQFGYNNQYQGGYNAPDNNGRYFSASRQQYKSSGAVYSKIRSGKQGEGLLIVNAWRKVKAGLMIAKCTPLGDYDKSGKFLGYTEHVGKEKGHSFLRYKVVITLNGMQSKYYCLMRLDTKIIVIPELSLCITPNGSGITKSGKRVQGYFGANYKRK